MTKVLTAEIDSTTGDFTSYGGSFTAEKGSYVFKDDTGEVSLSKPEDGLYVKMNGSNSDQRKSDPLALTLMEDLNSQLIIAKGTPTFATGEQYVLSVNFEGSVTQTIVLNRRYVDGTSVGIGTDFVELQLTRNTAQGHGAVGIKVIATSLPITSFGFKAYYLTAGSVTISGVIIPALQVIFTMYLKTSIQNTNTINNVFGDYLSASQEFIQRATQYPILFEPVAAGAITGSVVDVAFTTNATLESPSFTGTPTAPTAPIGTDTTQLATMAALWNQTRGIGIGLNTQALVTYNTPAELMNNTVNGGSYFANGTALPTNAPYFLTRIASRDINTEAGFIAILQSSNSLVYSGVLVGGVIQWTRLVTSNDYPDIVDNTTTGEVTIGGRVARSAQKMNSTNGTNNFSVVRTSYTADAQGTQKPTFDATVYMPTGENATFRSIPSDVGGGYTGWYQAMQNFTSSTIYGIVESYYINASGRQLVGMCSTSNGGGNSISSVFCVSGLRPYMNNTANLDKTNPESIATVGEITANGGGIVASGSTSSSWWYKFANGITVMSGYVTVNSGQKSAVIVPPISKGSAGAREINAIAVFQGIPFSEYVVNVGWNSTESFGIVNLNTNAPFNIDISWTATFQL